MYVQLRWSIVPYIFMYFLAFVIIGLMDFTDATLDPYRLFEAAYWQEVLLLTIGNILLLISTADIYIMKIFSELDTAQKESRDNSQMHRWFKLQSQISLALDALEDDFSLWLEADNLKEKRKAFKTKIHKKLAFINKLASSKSRLLYAKLQNARSNSKLFTPPKEFGKVRTFLWKVFSKPRPNWYVKLRKRYEEMLTKKYIDDRIEYMILRYDKINESFIRSGYNGAHGQGDRRVISKGRKFFQDHSPRIMMTTGIIAILRAFLYNPQTLSVAIAVNVTIKLIIALSNIIAGKNYAPRYFQEKIVRDETLRLSLMTQYIAHKTKNKPKEAKAK